LNYKKHAKAQLVSYLALIVAIVGVFFAQQTGTTGGEIRHTEIRANSVPVDVTGETVKEDND
jgi:hypothetical protein